MIVLKLFSLLVIYALAAFSISAEAKELKVQKIDKTLAGEVFIHYDPKLTKLIMEDRTKKGDSKRIRIARTKLSHNSSDEFVIDYWAGPSVDPGFLFYHVKNSSLTQVGYSIGGLHLAIPGNGYFYIWGHVNSYFNMRQKFTFKDGRILEVSQPFYYVGLDTQTLVDITIYRTKEQKDVVAKIKKGSSVSVLLNSEKFYLIKTENDILGWWRPKLASYYKAEEIDGIFATGD